MEMLGWELREAVRLSASDAEVFDPPPRRRAPFPSPSRTRSNGLRSLDNSHPGSRIFRRGGCSSQRHWGIR